MDQEGNKPLRNPRHEKFTQLVASGIKPPDAYVSVGYAKGGAAQATANLLKKTQVSSRIRFLQQAAAAATVADIAYDHQRVLSRLDTLSRKAEEAGQFSAAARCEELIGRSRGMFTDKIDHNMKWDGDLTKLTQQQLDALVISLASRFDDAARQAAEKEVIQ